MRRLTENSEVECKTTNRHLSEQQFAQLTEELIFAATANRTIPSDALAALANALGTLCSFSARREGLPLEVVLDASQHTVSIFAAAAETFMKDNPEAAPQGRFLD